MKKVILIPIFLITLIYLTGCTEIIEQIKDTEEAIMRILFCIEMTYKIILIQFILWIVIGIIKFCKNMSRDMQKDKIEQQVDEINNKLNLLMINYTTKNNNQKE